MAGANVVEGLPSRGPSSLSGRVMIAVPSHDGRCDVEFAYALAETVRLCTQIGIDVRPVFWPGEALIQRARNELVKIALQAGLSDLIFIDSDQEWKPEWVVQLLRYPVDCVGGAVIKKDEKREHYNVSNPQGLDIPVDPATGLLRVNGVGTGFLRLSARAMEALWDASEEYRDDQNERNRMMFDVRVVNGRLVSEDIGMALKLRGAGIETYLDPTITCSHIGRKKFTGDFDAWLYALQSAEFIRSDKQAPRQFQFLNTRRQAS